MQMHALLVMRNVVIKGIQSSSKSSKWNKTFPLVDNIDFLAILSKAFVCTAERDVEIQECFFKLTEKHSHFRQT